MLNRCSECNCEVCKCHRHFPTEQSAQAMVKALTEENERLRLALNEIREIAGVSEGAGFYEMLASKALGSSDVQQTTDGHA